MSLDLCSMHVWSSANRWLISFLASRYNLKGRVLTIQSIITNHFWNNITIRMSIVFRFKEGVSLVWCYLIFVVLWNYVLMYHSDLKWEGDQRCAAIFTNNSPKLHAGFFSPWTSLTLSLLLLDFILFGWSPYLSRFLWAARAVSNPPRNERT